MIAAVLFFVCLAAIAGYVILRCAYEKGYQSGYRKARENLGITMVDASYWFTSCNKPVSNALFIAGRKIMKNGQFRADFLRESVTKLGEQSIHTLPKEEVGQHLV